MHARRWLLLWWLGCSLVGCSHGEPTQHGALPFDASADRARTADAASASLDAWASLATEQAKPDATLADASSLPAAPFDVPPKATMPLSGDDDRDDDGPGHLSDVPNQDPPDASLASVHDAGPKAPIVCDAPLTYDGFGRAFMESYCLSCHGFKTEPLFTTLERIAKYKDEMIVRVLYEDVDALHMPPYGRPQPSAAEAERLERWLTCGPL